ncbi:hypothetical protein ABEF95_008825 [Exophiala dermatitidis]
MANNTTTLSGPPYGPMANGTVIVVFYEYLPQQTAALAFVALFALATIVQLVYLFVLRPRPWYFIPFILGGIAETFGYYGRSESHKDPRSLGPWIMQNLLLLAAPPFLAATVYMIFRRLTNALDANKLSFISPRWLTKIYVLIDIACIVSQFTGSVMPASGDPTAIELSKHIILGGLILQLVALALFILFCWQVHHRLSNTATEKVLRFKYSNVRWQMHFRALELATALLLVRSLVRMIEYLQGSSGFIASHEVFIYVFDAVPMVLLMAVFGILHPQRLCDEAKPECSNCVRFGLHCVTAQHGHSVESRNISPGTTPTPTPSASDGSTRRGRGRPRKEWAVLDHVRAGGSDEAILQGYNATASTPLAPSPPAGSPPLPELYYRVHSVDAELMVQWTDMTAMNMCSAASRADPTYAYWAFDVPRLGLEHPFILHLIYAFTGFHLDHIRKLTGQAPKYRDLSAAHFATGLSEFNKVLPTLDDSNRHAFGLAGVLVCFCAFADGPSSSAGYGQACSATGSDGQVVPWLSLIHGVRTLKSNESSSPSDRPPQPQSQSQTNDDNSTREVLADISMLNVVPRIDWEEPLRQLHDYILLSSRSSSAPCLVKAFENLVLVYEATFGRKDGTNRAPPKHRYVFVWLYTLADEFVNHLLRKEPLALLLLAYYAVLIRTMEHRWFMQGWAEYLLMSVRGLVGEELARWLVWPENQVQQDFRTERTT